MLSACSQNDTKTRNQADLIDLNILLKTEVTWWLDLIYALSSISYVIPDLRFKFLLVVFSQNLEKVWI